MIYDYQGDRDHELDGSDSSGSGGHRRQPRSDPRRHRASRLPPTHGPQNRQVSTTRRAIDYPL